MYKSVALMEKLQHLTLNYFIEPVSVISLNPASSAGRGLLRFSCASVCVCLCVCVCLLTRYLENYLPN